MCQTNSNIHSFLSVQLSSRLHLFSPNIQYGALIKDLSTNKKSGRIALGGSYSDHVFWIVPDDFTHIGEPDADLKVI